MINGNEEDELPKIYLFQDDNFDEGFDTMAFLSDGWRELVGMYDKSPDRSLEARLKYVMAEYDKKTLCQGDFLKYWCEKVVREELRKTK